MFQGVIRRCLQAAIFMVSLAFFAPAPIAAAELTPLTIQTASGVHSFEVEIAADDGMRAQGLMYRRELAADRGMLFDFEVEKPVSMWMKNTYIPLDMVFILADGQVHRVEERTQPHSLRTIESGADVRFVLEVPAGTANTIGIRAGDRVSHSLIGG
jgi:uncharacterized protein